MKPKKIPEVAISKIQTHPKCTTTSINNTKDANNDLQGNLYFFTNDEFEKVKNFYKSQNIDLIDESDSSLRFNINNKEIILTKENIYAHDPIQIKIKKIYILYNTLIINIIKN